MTGKAGTDRAAGKRLCPTDPDILALLVCPLTRGPLVYDEAAQELISETAGLAYPIRDGMPVLLIEAARVIGNA